MRIRIGIVAVLIGIAGCLCAVWPSDAALFGWDGPRKEWGLGAPSPWLIFHPTSTWYVMRTELVSISAAVGLLGLVSLAYGIALFIKKLGWVTDEK
jgi:hypothetical protein